MTHWTVSERDIPVAEVYPAAAGGGIAERVRERLSAVDLSPEWLNALPGTQLSNQERPEPEIPGIEPPSGSLSKWELQSQPLTVSPDDADRLAQFRDHPAAEMEALGDDTLQQELDLLATILDAA